MTTPVHEKKFPSDERLKLPRPFIFRRLHSLMGLALVIYLFEHLYVNSQAAFNGGSGFVAAVNKIHSLPYLKLIEILFIATPFFIHGIWGVKYAYTARLNSFRGSGKNPSLPQYKRNRAFSWQRITSWVILVGVIAHVVQMRFLRYPEPLFDGSYLGGSMGAAFLEVVKATFKSPAMVILYTVFVVASSYHAFNGLWTLLISWGLILTRRVQAVMRIVTTLLMWAVMAMGLVAIWGVYWLG